MLPPPRIYLLYERLHVNLAWLVMGLQVPHSYCPFSLLLLDAVLLVELMPNYIRSYLVLQINLLGSKSCGWSRQTSATATAMHKWFFPVDALSAVPSATIRCKNNSLTAWCTPMSILGSWCIYQVPRFVISFWSLLEPKSLQWESNQANPFLPSDIWYALYSSAFCSVCIIPWQNDCKCLVTNFFCRSLWQKWWVFALQR